MTYLDHNATSPLLPEVRAAMEPWLGVPANPGLYSPRRQPKASDHTPVVVELNDRP